MLNLRLVTSLLMGLMAQHPNSFLIFYSTNCYHVPGGFAESMYLGLPSTSVRRTTSSLLLLGPEYRIRGFQ